MEEELEGGQTSDTAARIKALDRLTARNLRHSQVISKVSDIVRELVENSLDADATTIQVYLEKFGKDKIEVRDNGHGLNPSDVRQIFQGGYTSKLQDTSNLSREKYLGFRGEALGAMCVVANVSVISKLSNESLATKYKFDFLGNIVSESKIAHGTGTTVIVEKLFENIPVRRQRLEDTVARSSELKDIEAYLKGAGIVHPKCHISLYHNTTRVWSKPSVQTIQQALLTVLGHGIAKQLRKLGPNKVEIDQQDGSENDSHRTVELYLPVKPVDMRQMSYTSNKMAMIFCNQKRVYIREFEKLIHRYVVANVEKPQPADQRRFPVSVLCIIVPPREVDFNLDMDKAKVLLVHKDKIRDAIENALIGFYGMDLRNSADEALEDCLQPRPNDDQRASSSDESRKNYSIQSKSNVVEACKNQSSSEIQVDTSFVATTPILNTSSTSYASRQSTIKEFLKNVPSTSLGFTQSPTKSMMNLEPVTVSFPVSKPNVDNHLVGKDSKDGSTPKKHGRSVVANFEISIDSQEESPPASQVESDAVKSSTLAEKRFEDADKEKCMNWLNGRIKDKFGDNIESVVPVLGPPISNHHDESDRFRTALLTGSSSKSNNSFSKHTNRSQPQAAPFSHPFNPLEPPSKRPRSEILGNKSNIILPPPVTPPVVPCGMLRMPNPRQVTLDSQWATPTGVFSQAASKSVVGVRIPLTPSRTKPHMDIPISPLDGLCNENRLPNTLALWGQQEQQFSITSQNTTKNNLNFSLNENFKVPTDSSPTQLTPLLHKEIPGGACGKLYIAQTYDRIGVFSPFNMMEFFPNESRECWSSEIEPLSLSLEDVSKMFQQFVTRSEINTTPVAEKIFHTISKLPHLTKAIPRV